MAGSPANQGHSHGLAQDSCQVEAMRSACLPDSFLDYRQERNVTIIDIRYDVGVDASELV